MNTPGGLVTFVEIIFLSGRILVCLS
jgi:hypothetical protein